MNKKLLKMFLYWMTERHFIYIGKEAGDSWPWTKDKILQEYKFTNPFRQNDKVTKELTKRLKGAKTLDDIFTRIIIFRIFNWPPTYDVLHHAGLIDKWDERKAIQLLNQRQKEGLQIFTGAYMITGSGSDGQPKHIIYCKAISKLLKSKSGIVTNIKSINTLQHATELLCIYPMVGPFIAYELVTDMRHTKLLYKATDIYTWANPGPGAKRGIHRLLFNTERGELPKDLYKKIDYQVMMQKLIPVVQEEFDGYAVTVKIEMRDIEHSLCEFDKYMRVKNGEGRPRSKYKGGKE